MKFIIILTTVLSLNVYAHKKHEHREHGAHEHGAGTLGIAFEGNKGKIDFKIPSESIFGFEHVAKTEKDKKIMKEALAKLESKITEMVAFDASLKCSVTHAKVEIAAEAKHEKKHDSKGHKHEKKAEHSDTLANFDVTCEKSPVGTEITFNFQKHFPKIKDLEVQVIVDNIQKSIEANKDNTKLLLK
ncbi:DUF2796 domain-containing protein [bacterium]|nr:DUF2796 domain-containing protein [bacterium]